MEFHVLSQPRLFREIFRPQSGGMNYGKNFDGGRSDLVGDNVRKLGYDQLAGILNPPRSAWQGCAGQRQSIPANGGNDTIGCLRVFFPDMVVNLGQIQLGISAPADFHDVVSLRAAKKSSISSSGTRSERRAAAIFSRHQICCLT